MTIEEKRVRRFQFLKKLYEVAEGNELEIVNMWDIGSELGWDRQQTEVAVQFLVGEGLVKYWTLGGGIGITHYGIVQYEEATNHPEDETEYFPPVINILSGNFTGAIVNVQSRLEQVAQSINTKGNLSEDQKSQIVTLMDELASQLANLPSELSEESEAIGWAASELAEEAASDQPNRFRFEILKEGLSRASQAVAENAPKVASLASDLITIVSAIAGLN